MDEVLEIEVIGAGSQAAEVERAARAAASASGVAGGHLAVTLVDAEQMARLNRDHRRRDEPTDALSFPIDGAGPVPGPRELGDVIVCPARADDLEEAVVHGVLHLCGYDHESDAGEMIALQERVLSELRL